METKKKYVMPEIEVVRFDEQDVITTSTFSTSGTYNGIWDIFNVSINGK